MLKVDRPVMTGEQARIWRILMYYQGAENPIRVADLAETSNLNARTVRGIVKDLVEIHHKPIGSTTKKPPGYYIITTEAEIRAVRGSLYRRAISILRRARAYDAKRSAWVAKLIGQLELVEKDRI